MKKFNGTSFAFFHFINEIIELRHPWFTRRRFVSNLIFGVHIWFLNKFIHIWKHRRQTEQQTISENFFPRNETERSKKHIVWRINENKIRLQKKQIHIWTKATEVTTIYILNVVWTRRRRRHCAHSHLHKHEILSTIQLIHTWLRLVWLIWQNK